MMFVDVVRFINVNCYLLLMQLDTWSPDPLPCASYFILLRDVLYGRKEDMFECVMNITVGYVSYYFRWLDSVHVFTVLVATCDPQLVVIIWLVSNFVTSEYVNNQTKIYLHDDLVIFAAACFFGRGTIPCAWLGHLITYWAWGSLHEVRMNCEVGPTADHILGVGTTSWGQGEL